MRNLALLLLLCASAFAQRPAHSSPVFWDGRDQFTLFDRHLVNRNLFEQLSAQPYRVGGQYDRFAFAADTGIGTQQPLVQSTIQSRFHGYFLADTYAAVRPFNGLDANLNVFFLNPSASDGYRLSAAAIPGLALHAHYQLFSVFGNSTNLDVVGTDLGWVTLGKGLILEQTPLEGMMAALSWCDWSLRYMYAGRALYDDDDFISTSLTVLEGLATATLLNWQKREAAPGKVFALAAPSIRVYYLDGALDFPAWAGVADRRGVRRASGAHRS